MTKEKVLHALEMCKDVRSGIECKGCPYLKVKTSNSNCVDALLTDVYNLLKEVKGGEREMKKVEYMINSRPESVEFECPYCNEKVKLPFKSVEYRTNYWGDGALVVCPVCKKTVELGEYEYE